MLRYRFIVRPDGVTVVRVRTRSYSWNEIVSFDSEWVQGHEGAGNGWLVTLVPRAGRPVKVPLPVPTTSGKEQGDRPGAKLTEALLGY